MALRTSYPHAHRPHPVLTTPHTPHTHHTHHAQKRAKGTNCNKQTADYTHTGQPLPVPSLGYTTSARVTKASSLCFLFSDDLKHILTRRTTRHTASITVGATKKTYLGQMVASRVQQVRLIRPHPSNITGDDLLRTFRYEPNTNRERPPPEVEGVPDEVFLVPHPRFVCLGRGPKTESSRKKSGNGVHVYYR